MLVLAFDTATSAVSVALCEWAPGEHSSVEAIAEPADRRRHAEVLTPSIAAVLDEMGATTEDLCAIVVGVGPGPFTGLRVGLVTARAMGAALRVPVHGVCTLDVLAWQSGRSEPFVVASDARRKEVYWARYDNARERAEGPWVSSPADAAAAGLPVIGEAAVLYADVFGGRGAGPLPDGDGVSAEAEVRVPVLPSAAALAKLAVSRLSGGEGPPLLPPEPLYLRRPDAREPGPRKRVTPAGVNREAGSP